MNQQESGQRDSRIIMAANAEPVKTVYEEKEEEKIQVPESSPVYGGVTTAGDRVMREGKREGDFKDVWIGTARGGEPDLDARVVDEANSLYLPQDPEEGESRYKLVRIPKDGKYSPFYYGMSNDILWPISHAREYRGDSNDIPNEFLLEGKVNFENEEEYWDSYQHYNRKFVEAIEDEYQAGDTVILNDYHFFLAPGMLRERLPEANIIFFNHIPVPSWEILDQLDHSQEIWDGLAGADLLGVHTEEWANNVLDNAEKAGEEVDYENNIYHSSEHGKVKVGVFPLGIRYDFFNNYETGDREKDLREDWEKEFAGDKILYSVDRLEYTKNLTGKVNVLRKLFEKDPDLIGEITLIERAPKGSRIEELTTYQQYLEELEDKVDQLNQDFQTDNYKPMELILEGTPQPDLIAEYRAADSFFLYSIRDGMNLVAKEIPASCPEPKRLILSQEAGASNQLEEAFLVDPDDDEGTADTIKEAIYTDVGDIEEDWEKMRREVSQDNLKEWLKDILEAGKRAHQEFQ